MFITESWFWRGTQSAIFYYVSCSPCLELKYKRQRRKDATRSEKEKAEIITRQPGVIVQPGPFQTNPDWAEEIILGPGPPKGWKKEKILQGYTERAREQYRKDTQLPQLPVIEPETSNVDYGEDATQSSPSCTSPAPKITFSEPAEFPFHRDMESRVSQTEPMSPVSEITVDSTTSTSLSDHPEQSHRPRPSMERRLSSAVENLKGTIKAWNLRRYEREDEVLSGFNEKISRMWDRATSYGAESGAESRKVSFTGRKRAGTTGTSESDAYDYQRAVRNPEINELHPPTVSQLPATRDEAAWMLLPPPSAAIMAGRSRPQDEPSMRWPLAQIGRNPNEWEQWKSSRNVAASQLLGGDSRSSKDSRRTPDLSNSSSDEGWSDEDEEVASIHVQKRKRHSTPVEGWVPVMPKPTAQPLFTPAKHWESNEAGVPTPVYV